MTGRGTTRPAQPHAAPSSPPRVVAPVAVAVAGPDQLGCVGAAAALQADPSTRLTPVGELGAGVLVVVVARARIRDLRSELGLRASTADGPVVLVTDHLTDHDLLPAIAVGVAAVLPRARLAGGELVAAVRSVAAGRSHLPPHLQGALTRHLRLVDAEVLRPRGLTIAGLSVRECDVLRLLGDGLSTEEVARRLRCSERTVKYDLAEVMRRHGLRTRAQAVARAVRIGAI